MKTITFSEAVDAYITECTEGPQPSKTESVRVRDTGWILRNDVGFLAFVADDPSVPVAHDDQREIVNVELDSIYGEIIDALESCEDGLDSYPFPDADEAVGYLCALAVDRRVKLG